MTDLMRYASQLTDHSTPGEGEEKQSSSLPPVHLWDPPFCGDINMLIGADGTWYYEGTPIGRARLVKLFSGVLKKENDNFFLVTPVEKLGIKIEDAPFVAVLCTVEHELEQQKLIFTTNVGDQIIAGTHHPIVYRKSAKGNDQAPYIMVRGGLEAKIARPVFYELVELGKVREIEGQEWFGVVSQGHYFPFALAADIFEEGQ